MAPKTKQRSSVPPMTIENAKIIYRNFSGAAKKFNAKGLRNFHIVLEPDLAKVVERDGWNVRWHDPREEGDMPWASIKVALRFDNYPPRIVMVTADTKTTLDEESVDILDWAEIEKVDLVLSPSSWEVNGKQGIKAYLRKMFVTLNEDELEVKYRTVTKDSDRDSEEDGD